MARRFYYPFVSDRWGNLFEWMSRGRYRLCNETQALSVPMRETRSLAKREVMHRRPDGSYVVTHYSVVLVDCPQCHARIGELCRGAFGSTASVHFVRKDAAYGRRKR